MKITLKTFFFVLVNIQVFSQSYIDCELYSNKGIKTFFDTHLSNENPDPKYFHVFFSIETEKQMIAFGKWARANGFETEQRKTITEYGTSLKKTDYFIIIEKPIELKTLDYFNIEMKNIDIKRRELKIKECGGIGVGISLKEEKSLKK